MPEIMDGEASKGYKRKKYETERSKYLINIHK